MTIFGISKTNIIETRDSKDMTLGGKGKDDYVTLYQNRTIPDFLEDGVDSLSISKESENRYLVEYWGYLTGSHVVTREGIEELGTALLGDRDQIPSWTISSDVDELPDWIPSGYSPPDPVNCGNCGANVPVTEILTPFDGEFDRYCRSCWEASQ